MSKPSSAAQEAETFEPMVEWTPWPRRRLASAIQSTFGEDAWTSFDEAMETLRGYSRIQDDTRGRTWLVLHPTVTEAFQALYHKLEWLEAESELAAFLRRDGYLRLALSAELAAPLAEKDWPAELNTARDYVASTARDFAFEDADFVEQWGQCWVLTLAASCSGLLGMLPKLDKSLRTSFLSLTTRILLASANKPAPTLEAIELALAASESNQSVQLIDRALSNLDDETASRTRSSRIREVPLKSDKKLAALAAIQGIIGQPVKTATRHATEDERRRQRSAPKRTKKRSQRLARLSDTVNAAEIAAALAAAPASTPPAGVALRRDHFSTTRARIRRRRSFTKRASRRLQLWLRALPPLPNPDTLNPSSESAEIDAYFARKKRERGAPAEKTSDASDDSKTKAEAPKKTEGAKKKRSSKPAGSRSNKASTERKSERRRARRSQRLGAWSTAQDLSGLVAQSLTSPQPAAPPTTPATTPSTKPTKATKSGKDQRRLRKKTRSLSRKTRAASFLTEEFVASLAVPVSASEKGEGRGVAPIEAPTTRSPNATDPVPSALSIEKDSRTKESATKDSSAERNRKRKGAATGLAKRPPYERWAGFAAAALVLLFLIGKIDWHAGEREDLNRALAALDPKKGYKTYSDLRARLDAFYSSDPGASLEMVQSLDEKVQAAVKALEGELNSLAGRELEDSSSRSQAELLRPKLMAWREAKSSLADGLARLETKIEAARSWSGFGDALAEIALEHGQACELELHVVVAAEEADPADQDLASDLRTKLQGAKSRGNSAVFELLAGERYHPAIREEGYALIIARIDKEMAVDGRIDGSRFEQTNTLRRNLVTLRDITRAYNKGLVSAWQRLEAGNLNDARELAATALRRRDLWSKRVLAWLESEKASNWLALMLARRQPETPRPDSKPGETRPEPGKPETIVVKPEPVVTEEEEEPRTYKEDFVLALERYKDANSSNKTAIVDELAQIMRDSLPLVADNPAMALDVLAFYEKRKSRFGREAELEKLFDEHLVAAWKVLLPATTGPTGFLRLRDLCKKLNYKDGAAELAPILDRLKPLDPGNATTAAQRADRERRAQVLSSVEAFVSARRVENIKSFKKLLTSLRKEKVCTETIAIAFKERVEKIINRVGKDPRMAAGLVAELDALPKSNNGAPSQRERVEKAALARLEKISADAENDFIDGVVKAIKAKEPGVGFDLLMESLAINPQSDRAYKGLGYIKVGDRYVRPWEAKMRRKGLEYDPKIRWYKGAIVPGQYYDLAASSWKDLAAANQQHANANSPWIFESEHFVLRSCADLEETMQVLERLEAFYLRLFRQFDLFFAPDGNAEVVFGLSQKKPLVVNYYRSREQFQQNSQPPTDWAAGFYDGGRHASFFYSTPGDWTVLQHEIVHQILGENASGYCQSWLAEGTAVYMENAWFDDEGKLCLGPVPRHRRPYTYLSEAQAERVTIKFSEVIGLKTGAQWGAGNVSDHYKGAGAVVYFFMSFDSGRYRGTFLHYLRDSYNRGASENFEHYFGLSRTNLEWFFDRFYKQGFTSLDGRIMTHEERELIDAERIARLFPEPDLKTLLAGKKKTPAGPELSEPAEEAKKPEDSGTPGEAKPEPVNYSEDIKSLLRTLSSNPNMDRRREAAEALSKAGDEGKSALRSGLDELIVKAKGAISQLVKDKKASYRKHMAGEILRRRKEAYDFIMDPAKYPDANHGAAAQPQVDKLVAALRAAWLTPSVVLIEQQEKVKELFDRLDLYHAWAEELLGSAPGRKEDREEACKEFDAALKITEIPLSVEDQQIRTANEAILAYNARAKTSMDAEELDCCLATNEYRIMFGLKALKYFDPLVVAARKHSDEMRRLNFFAHESPTPANRDPAQRCAREGAKYTGENIAKGYGTGRAAFLGWYNSSGHHRNILGKIHTSIGIGRSESLWTQDFGRDNPN